MIEFKHDDILTADVEALVNTVNCVGVARAERPPAVIGSCPRSIMLYLIFKANHSDLSYTGGQNPFAQYL